MSISDIRLMAMEKGITVCSPLSPFCGGKVMKKKCEVVYSVAIQYLLKNRSTKRCKGLQIIFASYIELDQMKSRNSAKCYRSFLFYKMSIISPALSFSSAASPSPESPAPGDPSFPPPGLFCAGSSGRLWLPPVQRVQNTVSQVSQNKSS